MSKIEEVFRLRRKYGVRGNMKWEYKSELVQTFKPTKAVVLRL